MDKRGIRLLAVLLGLIGAFLTGYSFYQRGGEAVLADRGITVPGVVRRTSARSEGNTRGGGRYYYLHVAYVVGRTEQTRKFTVTYSAYRSHPFGSQVEVVYDPQNPEHARLVGNLNNPASWKTLLIGIGAILGSIAAAVWARAVANSERSDVPDLDEAIARAKGRRS